MIANLVLSILVFSHETSYSIVKKGEFMKLDRLLGIIIYLLNHDNVPARLLAEKFQVSVRTIQRDILSISSIGIPIYSLDGKYGGYSILPTYKIKNSQIRDDEQQLIIKALESLATSYKDDSLNHLIEKYNAIIDREGGQRIFWDFSVARENKQVQELNICLEQAIAKKSFINFDYQNAEGIKSEQYVEPLAIHYKWYAWYLFSYNPLKKEFRTFKVARMRTLEISRQTSAIDHGDIKKRMAQSEQEYCKTSSSIEIHFAPQETGLIEEHFPDCPIETLSDHECRIFLHVPARERLWRALLLSFGDKAWVTGPECYKQELIQTARKFLSNYDI